jgi:hypothetical protein
MRVVCLKRCQFMRLVVKPFSVYSRSKTYTQYL